MKGNGLCYTAIPGNKPGERIGIIKAGEKGYFSCEGYDWPPHTLEQVQTFVNELNERLAVPKDVAESAMFASLFGWHIPAAQKARKFFELDRTGLDSGEAVAP